MIASYTVVVGLFNVLSLLTGRSGGPPGESQIITIANCVRTFVQSLALLAGLKGLVGIMHRDPRRLRLLLLYHVAEIVMHVIELVLREWEACDELQRLQRLHKSLKFDCASYRIVYLCQYTIHVVIVCYFIYVIWSLAVRLEAGEFARPNLFEHELADPNGLADSWPPWFLVGHAGSENTANLLQQQRTPLTGGSSGVPTPFSGPPRTLDENPNSASVEPFRGTPHRLE